ncbi:PREDICTED: glutaredoxin isoform X1 [Theobroma cacao]|uniref:Glutaredoxin isoform X1 n=1 Tax=Theobroma cacao TaxID=3641 RepID=A0AB32W289_THECC|nr:PREDICTED: glutaredoxin isoform X1 [Theobroma cacao]
MGSWFSSSKKSKEEIQMALDKVKQIVSSNQVVVFSKTYCGFCNRVKQLFTQLGASYKTIELNQESDGDDMQAALLEWTGQRTVPNVFIGGIHIGGCDCKPRLLQLPFNCCHLPLENVKLNCTKYGYCSLLY